MNTPASRNRRPAKEQPAKDRIPSGFRAADESGIAVPSRWLLLDFLTESKGPVTFQQICQHFEIRAKAAVHAITARLERMRAQGIVLNDRKGRYALPASMDIVSGRVSGHANGYGFVIPDDGSGDLFLHHRQMRKVLHGDRVLARIKRIDERGRKEGVVVEVVVDSQREIVGHFHVESRIGFVEPDDSRYARDITIPGDSRNGAEDGDIVVARIIQHPVTHHHAVGEIVEVIGKQMAVGMETEIAIRKHSISAQFPEQVHAQLQKMKGALQSVQMDKGRRDIRNLPLVTIDGEDARDFDDAVYCEPRDGKSGWRLVVAIADVGHYVHAGSALDHEAVKRGNSVYFPNRVVPMLPEELSNGICSLKPDEDRYCMVCDMKIAGDGEVVDFNFYPALMRSHARLTYAQVHTIVVEKNHEQRRASVTPHLDHLYEMSLCLQKKRGVRGAIDFEFPEPHIEFDDKKRIRRISARARNDAHRLIEECMLAANVCAAQFLQKNPGARAIYRNHLGPTNESLIELRRFLSGMGLKLGGSDAPAAADYAQLVKSVSTQADIAPVVQMLLLRSLSQAVYGTEQAGHFALAYPVYTHFTSPIRRYSDLVVHRQIRRLIGEQKDARPEVIESGATSLEKIAEQCSFTERRADDASRDVIAWLKAEFMQDKVGKQFTGVISGVKEFGVFVQLDDIFIDGLVHVTGLGDDYYHFDPLHFQLVGERTGRRFRLGQRLQVIVARASLEDAKIDFELCADDKTQKSKTQPTARAKKSVNKKFANKKPTNKKSANKKTRESKPRGKKVGKRSK